MSLERVTGPVNEELPKYSNKKNVTRFPSPYLDESCP